MRRRFCMAGWVVMRRLCALLGLVAGAGCGAGLPTYRALHVVDGEVVYSRPVGSPAYAAYLQARIAMDGDPPRDEDARIWIERALLEDPFDPHLWTTRAEIEARLGRSGPARDSAHRALTLRPGYPPAERILATVSTTRALH